MCIGVLFLECSVVVVFGLGVVFLVVSGMGGFNVFGNVFIIGFFFVLV